MTSSSAAVNGAGSGGGATPAFFSASFSVSISILVARKSAPADLLTSCLATASRLVISRRSPSMVTTTFSLSASISMPAGFSGAVRAGCRTGLS